LKFELHILGSGAATPTLRRNPSGQLLDIHDKYYLIDCSEGTQTQLRKAKIKFQRINQIFISHLHGDHYLGMPGLLSSMHLLGRSAALDIYSSPELEELIKLNLKISETYLNFELRFHHLEKQAQGLIFEDNSLEVWTFPLRHRIACHGFLFKEKPRQPKISKDMIQKHRLNVEQIRLAKQGLDIPLSDGSLLPNALVATMPPPPRSFAYCSDTIYDPGLIPFLSNVDLLYHESTFLNEHEKRAKDTFHTTAAQAAMIAAQANAKSLLLGHFSSRYMGTNQFLEEASAHFKNVQIADDLMIVNIPHTTC
jgi:ribonuclease Z